MMRPVALPARRLALLFWWVLGVAGASEPPVWDDTRPVGWSGDFERVAISPSVAGGPSQAAMWHSASGKKPQPLIVSLHTWSGDYAQRDPLAELAVARGFNYIHPDFQGPNVRPEACGSDLVVADLDAAIDYALARGNVDRANIHVIGVSGGGHAAMLAWMRSRHDVRSFSAWVGISDLEKWHAESLARHQRYAGDLERVTTGTAGHFDPVEARRRSPLWMQTPIARRQGSRLLLHAGVHDGYTGSVPITQTIEFYNHVVAELAPGAAEARVPAAIAEALARRQALPGDAPSRARQPGETIYERNLHDRVRLNIFEGGHEMLVARALDHVPSPPAASPAATLHPHKP